MNKKFIGVILILCITILLTGCRDVSSSNPYAPDTLFEFLLMNWDDVRTNENFVSSFEPVLADDSSEVMIGYYQDGDITFDTYFLLEIGETAYDSFSTEKGTILGIRYEYSTAAEAIDDAISVMEQILNETEREYGEADTLPYAVNQYHTLTNAKDELLNHDRIMWSEEWYLSNIDPNMVLHIRIFRMDNEIYVVKEYEINPMAAKQFILDEGNVRPGTIVIEEVLSQLERQALAEEIHDQKADSIREKTAALQKELSDIYEFVVFKDGSLICIIDNQENRHTVEDVESFFQSFIEENEYQFSAVDKGNWLFCVFGTDETREAFLVDMVFSVIEGRFS